jgi:putative ABC transport system substrate-binding protein
MNNRRKLVVALGAGMLSPRAAFAQQKKVWRIGFLWEVEPSIDIPRVDAFKKGMSELGYVERRDYVVEERSARSDLARLPALAAELVASNVDVILPAGTPAALAMTRISSDIPLVVATAGDPVGSGLAASLARPGGKVTGLTNMSSELVTKRLDVLRELLPSLQRVGLLFDPNNALDVLSLSRFEAYCKRLKLQAVRSPVRNADDVSGVFSTLTRSRAQAVIITPSNTNNSLRTVLVQTVMKHRLPAVGGRADYAEAGGLISYAPDILDLHRRSAAYVDKIFKGAKPGDLPIEQPTRFEFVLNLKTAKVLGLKIPNSILVQATKVID